MISVNPSIIKSLQTGTVQVYIEVQNQVEYGDHMRNFLYRSLENDTNAKTLHKVAK